MRRIKSLFGNTNFAREFVAISVQAFNVALGLVGARIVSVGSLLIFVGFTGAAPYALIAVYLATTTILWIVASAQYEQAIVFAKTDRQAAAAGFLALLIASCVVLCTGISVLVIYQLGVRLPGGLQNTAALLLLPLSLAARVAMRIALNFATRFRCLSLHPRAAWVQSIVQSLSLFCLFLTDVEPVLCFAAADVLGYASAALSIFHRLPRDAPLTTSIKHAVPMLRSVMIEWRELQIWNLPGSLMATAALALPAYIVPLTMPITEAGQVLLGLRVLELPQHFITGAATPILQHRLLTASHGPRALAHGALWLTLIGAAIFGPIASLAVIATPLLSGTSWALAMPAVAMFAFYHFGLTIAGPLIDLISYFRAERRAFAVHFSFFATQIAVSCLLLGGITLSAAAALMGIAALARATMLFRLLRIQ